MVLLSKHSHDVFSCVSVAKHDLQNMLADPCCLVEYSIAIEFGGNWSSGYFKLQIVSCISAKCCAGAFFLCVNWLRRSARSSYGWICSMYVTPKNILGLLDVCTSLDVCVRCIPSSTGNLDVFIWNASHPSTIILS